MLAPRAPSRLSSLGRYASQTARSTRLCPHQSLPQQIRHVQHHAAMPEIVDDKSPHVIPFILAGLADSRRSSQPDSSAPTPPPFILGLNGVQGIGKTTLVTTLATTLRNPPHNLNTLTFSIDDLYLPRPEQEALAASNPSNPLIQHRGQPSTHDMSLGLELFRALRARQPDIAVPAYNKSAHRGKGDRVPRAEWQIVNQSGTEPVDVVIFEGWCVGFRSLPDAEVEARWWAAREAAAEEKEEHAGFRGHEAGRLRSQRLEDAQYINTALRDGGYDELFGNYLDAFVYLDAERTGYVYDWRLEQEAALRRDKGVDGAMSEEDVITFVDGYYPAYELFSDGVRRGVLCGDPTSARSEGGKQMRLVVGRDRAVRTTEVV